MPSQRPRGSDLFALLKTNQNPGPHHEAAQDVALPTPLPLRLIAYYLPQFHAIAENDAWWGTGFTEWTNVTRATPHFADHYQPHLPADLGFYDLGHVDVLRKQAALAKHYGISGFCIHHYWFSGTPLLERPLNILLDNPDIDLPFFLNWANESWSRRWDGSESDILMDQRYSADNDIAFARSIEPVLRDPRYMRVGDRPLLMLYRPQLLPDARQTVARWREHFVACGIGDPFIIMPQAFGDDDPRVFGMDGAAGFPPHKTGWAVEDTGGTYAKFDENYAGRVMDYDAMAHHSLANRPTDFPYFPGVCPGWDNHARKGSNGVGFVGNTPQKYGRWLEGAARQAMEAASPDERIVFINAWNEWAEGAHLEPDRHFGHGFLAETARVLADMTRGDGHRLPRPGPISVLSPQRPKRRSRLRRLVDRLVD